MTPSAARKAYHAHESALCQAARAVISAAGLGTARLPGDPSNLPDEGWRIRFRRGDATGAMALATGYAAEPTSRPIYSQWSGVLEVEYARRRAENLESAIGGIERDTDEKRAALRDLFDVASYPFTAANLTYLIVTDIMPLTGEEAVDPERHLDLIRERFRLTYEIKRSAIPAPSP